MRFIVTSILLIFAAGNAVGGDGFFRKAREHKNDFRRIADVLLARNYHKNFAEPAIFIEVDELQDADIRAFCKRFHITDITIQNYEDKGYVVPMDSVVIFHRNYTPIIGSQRDIIIDFKREERSYSDFHKDGSELVKIDARMYYYRH